jgi:hypothetical protein
MRGVPGACGWGERAGNPDFENRTGGSSGGGCSMTVGPLQARGARSTAELTNYRVQTTGNLVRQTIKQVDRSECLSHVV